MYWKDTTLRMTLRSGMRVRSGRASVKLAMKVVNGKLLLQEYEPVHTHPRNNAAVADFVKSGQFFSFEQLWQAITQFQEVSRHKVVISIGNGFVFCRVPPSTLQRR